MLQNTKVFYAIVILLIGVIGIWLFFPVIKQGPGTAYDSIAYLSTAESLAHGDGFMSYDGRPYSNWPPLYPLILAPFYELFSSEVLQRGMILNVLAFLSTALVLYRILDKLLENRFVILFGLILSLGSLFSLLIFNNLISESYYIPFTLLFIFLLHRCLTAPSKKDFVLLIVAAWLCTLQRYVGIVPVSLGCFFLLVLPKSQVSTTVKKALLFGSIAILPLTGWLYRNILVTKTLSGEDRTTELKYVKYNLVNAVEQVWEWFLPYYPKSGFVFIAAFLLVGLVTGMFFYLWQNRKSVTERRLLLILLLGHTGAYVLFITGTALIQSSSPIEPRLSAPAYFTAVPVFCFLLQRFFNYTNLSSIKYVILFTGLLSIGYTYHESITRWNNQMNYGEGLSNERWRQSAVLAYLRTADAKKLLHQPTLYTSFPEALYFYGFGNIKNVVQEHRIGVLNRKFRDALPPKKVIWFGKISNFNEFLRANGYPTYYKVLRSFDDGVIVEVLK